MPPSSMDDLFAFLTQLMTQHAALFETLVSPSLLRAAAADHARQVQLSKALCASGKLRTWTGLSISIHRLALNEHLRRFLNGHVSPGNPCRVSGQLLSPLV